jgi:DNA-binding LytR/AlgR family response regulator
VSAQPRQVASTGLTVLAVDDELPALRDLARLLRASATVQAVDTAASAGEALAKLGQQAYDALFLDVRMPEVDGVELARVLRRFARPPAVVFVTAYEDAAIDAFQVRALDYLLKPVARRRLEEALGRVPRRAAPADPTVRTEHLEPAELDVVPAQNLRGGGLRLVPRSSIYYVEASGDYVRLVADDGRFLLRGHLLDFEQRWRRHGFVRVHRRYLANLGRATEVRPHLNGTASLVFTADVAIAVSRRQAAQLARRLRLER